MIRGGTAGQQFKHVKAVFDQANSIIIATDADREGENIAYSIIKAAGATDKITKRLWINSNLPSAVQAGFKSLRDAAETYSYYQEARIRQISDWLVGMNFTRLFTLKATHAGLNHEVYSAGRVQTPVLALVAKNRLDRNNFKPVPYWLLQAKTEKSGIKVTFKTKEKFPSKTELERVMAENKLHTPYTAEIGDVLKEHKTQSAPQLFDLAGIQSFANANWGYTNDKTLELVQALYDANFVTYPRTEESLISAEEFNEMLKRAPELMTLLGLDVELKNSEPRKKYVGDYKAHSALLPTTLLPKLDQLPEDQLNIYIAIAQRSLMMFAPDREYDRTEVKINADALEFSATGNVETNLGWKKVQIDDQDENETDMDKGKLPEFEKGETVYLEFDQLEKQTQPQKAYTPSSLGGKNSIMEKLNLGTPATRANIIKTLVDRQYMKLTKNKYEPTDKGLLMYQLIKDSKLGSAEMTASWENQLKEIEENREKPESFLTDIKAFVREELVTEQKRPLDDELLQKNLAASMIGKCPKCHQGDIVFSRAYHCTNPDCDFMLWPEVAHKKLTDTQVKQLIDNGRTTKLVTGLKSSKGSTFKAFIVLNSEFKTAFEFEKKGK
ncbi:DNA topoisomerase [Lacticaseibacillus saniviri]|uniref:DNA topoisomerase n=1 Tax=Lacticaseibacillus saniviri JCM 17471 = DSM 24301 TaxID=1293598 RepID=A0A0R2MPC5_9LACO|nr:DNA topoisomerase [Lacticaseibacillus saniviri]KRO15521.1 DNA topoisomerase [Lacticaseibacillus saniviri JCM 17471 = DSM 24301]